MEASYFPNEFLFDLQRFGREFTQAWDPQYGIYRSTNSYDYPGGGINWVAPSGISGSNILIHYPTVKSYHEEERIENPDNPQYTYTWIYKEATIAWASGATGYGTEGNDNIEIIDNDYCVAYAYGGNDNIRISGDAQWNTIYAGYGNDTVQNNATNTIIYAQGGNNYINGGGFYTELGDGDDIVINGHDIRAGNGNNQISGSGWQVISGNGHDRITGSFTNIQSGDGNDYISSNGGQYINAGNGNDTILGNALTISADGGHNYINVNSAQQINTGEGNDKIIGSANEIYAGSGDNYISVSGSQKIQTEAGNDTIIGSANEIYAGSGDNYISVSGSQKIQTEAGNDTIIGSANEIYAGSGDNYISVSGSQKIQTEAGNDTIIGSANEIYAGSGDNYISVSGSQKIQTEAGNDTIIGEIKSIDSGNGNNFVSTSGENQTIITGCDNDTISINGGKNQLLDSGDGNDYIANKGDNATIQVQNGDKTIENYGENDLIITNSINATIKNKGTNLSLQASDDNDFVGILNGNITLRTNTGDSFDSLSSTVGASNSLFISLGNGNDTIQNADSNVTIQVGNGDKTIENYGKNVVFMLGSGQQSLKNDGAETTIKAAEDFDSDADNVIINEGENSVIDVSNLKGVVVNGFDVTDEDNQVSASDFNSAVVQMEAEAQNFYQNIFSNNATLRSIFENGVNSPYLRSLDEASNSDSAIAASSEMVVTSVNSRNLLRTSSNNLASYAINELTQKASEVTSLQNVLMDDVGTILDGFRWLEYDRLIRSQPEYLRQLTKDLAKLKYSKGSITTNFGLALNGAGAIINWAQMLTANEALAETRNIYGYARDNLLENYSPENLRKLQDYTRALEEKTDDAVISRAAAGTSMLGFALALMPFAPPAGFVIGAVFALNSAFGNSVENLFYKYGLNTHIGNAFSSFWGINSNNKCNNVKIIGGSKDDKVFNMGSGGVIKTFAGNDNIINTGERTKIEAGSGHDSIENFANHVEIDAGLGNDLIANFGGENVTIDASKDDRAVIYNFGKYVLIEASNGNDTIKNNASNVLINAQNGGEDYIVSNEDIVEIYAGNNSDFISNSGNNVLVEAGDGNNVIDNAGDSTEINTGIGNDKIKNHGRAVNIHVGNGNDNIENLGEDVKIYAGAGNDTVTNYFDKVTIDGGVGNDKLQNIGDSVLIETKDTQSDYIFNSGENVTVRASENDDVITNGGSNVIIDASTGSNVIQNFGNEVLISAGTEEFNTYGEDNFIYSSGDSVTIFAENRGNDTIQVSGDNNSIFTGAGDDSIINQATNTMIEAGEGKDSIDNFGNSVTITANNGDNVITNSGENISIIAGEGEDSMENSGTGATIETGGGEDTIINRGSDTSINSASGNDTISNTAENVTINSDNGSDEIRNFANLVSILAGATDDLVSDDNFIHSEGNEVYISAKKGKDTISAEGDQIEISSGAGDDSIENRATNSMIEAGDGDDIINNFGDSVTINANTGDDEITNNGSKVSIIGGEGADNITNFAVSTMVESGSSNDTINSTGAEVSINAGEGDDKINTSGENSKINSGSGKDTVENSGNNVQINLGTDNDSIKNSGNFVLIEGSGDNQILNKGTNVNISVENGNNNISNDGRQTTIISGSGKDSITNVESNVTINTDSGNDSVINSNENVYIDSGAENDFIRNSAAFVTINAGIGDDIINNIGTGSENVSINAGEGDDQIENIGNRVQVNLGTGNDIIKNIGDSVSINGEGNNQIQNNGSAVKISTANGTSTITNAGERTTITSGNGADSITNRSSNAIINSGAGNDVIIIDGGSNSKITAGSGNDTIYSNGSKNVFNYFSGDGNDVIYRFSENDTLDIASANYTTVVGSNESDVVVNIGNGSITLKDAKGKNLNINGTLNIDYTKLINGLKNGVTASDIYVSGKVITLKKSALSTNELSLNDKEYTLALADDVEKAITSEPMWKVSGSTATYRTITSKGYSVSADRKKISYSSTDIEGHAIIIINGVKTIDGIAIDDDKKIITLRNANLDTNSVTFIANVDGYTFALDGVASSTPTDAHFSGNTFKSASKTAGYELSSDKKSIVYTAPVAESDLFTLSGVKSTNGISVNSTNKTVTIKSDNLDAKSISFSSNSGGYSFALDGVNPSTSTDSHFVGNTFKSASKTAGYELDSAKTTIKYTTAKDAIDLFTLSGIKSASGIVVDTSKKIVTLKAANLNAKNVTFSANTGGYTMALASDVDTTKENISKWTTLSSGNVAYLKDGTGSYYALNSKKTAVTYNSSVAGANQIEFSGVKGTPTLSGSTVKLTASNFNSNVGVKSNAGGYTLALSGDFKNKTLTGTANADKITSSGSNLVISGGKGNDTATLGSNNTFLYAKGDGNDVLYSFGNDDKIKLTGTTKATPSISGKDVIITTDGGKITVKDAAQGKVVKIVNDKDSVLSAYTYYADRIVNGKSVTLTSTFKGTFDAKNFTNVDGSAVTNAIKITGGKGNDSLNGGAGNDSILGGKANDKLFGNAGNDSLSGGDGNDTLLGDAGNDNLTGGKGKDTFVFSGGKDTITDYTAGDDNVSVASSLGKGKFSVSGKNVIMTYGSNTLTITNGLDKKITFNGMTSTYKKSGIFNADSTAVTLPGATKTFDASAKTYSKVVTVDGSAVGSTIKITGNDKANVFTAGANGSTLTGGKGKDTLNGGAGNDSILGGADNDKLLGNAGNDILSGGDGNDTLSGGAGNDKLTGDKGNDSLVGGNGADTLTGGAGNDNLTGGKGKDTFVFSGGKDTITDYTVGDDNVSVASSLGKGKFSVSGKNVIMTYGSNTLTITNGLDKKITFNGMTSTYKKSGIFNADSTAVTLPGATKTFDASAKTYSKVVTVDGSAVSSTIKITGNDKANVLTAGANGSTLSGGKGNDSLNGGAGNDSILGGANNDKLFGNTGNDSLKGGDGADTLSGGSGNDKLYGDKGNDSLWGGAGNDTLYGGTGDDIFIYKPGEGTDTIFDYAAGDMLKILKKDGKEGGTFTKAKFASGDLTLTISGGGTIIFDNISKGDKFNINDKTYTLGASKLK